MKKLLISILIILLIVLAYFTMFKGLSLGKIEILSVEQIIAANDKLISDIEATNLLLKRDYPTKKTELSQEVKTLLDEKQTYFDLAKMSTEGEIAKANTEETYLLEYLFVRIGNHAKSKGVNIKMDIKSASEGNEANMKNIDFTIDGHYSAVIQFVGALENDDKLNFKIENYKMVKGNANLTATFKVTGIRIRSDKLSNAGQSSTQTDTTNDNTAQPITQP